MTRAEKQVVIDKLKVNFSNARAVFLTNLVGATSNDAVKVRKEVREAEGTIVVTKNTLFNLAAKGTPAEDMLSNLKGNNAVAFAFGDAPGVAKALFEASKELEAVELRGGVLGEQVLTNAEVLELAQLPSRDEMLATLLATFNAPVSAFVRVMDAIKRQKEEGGEVQAAAANEEAPAAVEAKEEAPAVEATEEKTEE